MERSKGSLNSLMKRTNWQKWVLVTDTHGNEINEECSKAFLKFCDEYSPDVRIHGGDVFDFKALRNGASADDKAASMEDDFVAGRKFLREYFVGDCKKVLTFGNHDYRIFANQKSSNATVAYAAYKGSEEITKLTNDLGVETLPYHIKDGRYQMGDATFIHGFECSMAGLKREAMTNPTQFTFQGHIHSDERICTPAGTLQACPAMCNLVMPYNETRSATLRHTNGWIAGAMNTKTGEHVYSIAQNINNQWVCPTI